MNLVVIHKIVTYCIAGIWLTNGLLCKVLKLIPRHEQIIARILSDSYSRPLTILIGISEIIMAIWILSGYRSRINAITQIAVIATMNILEFILVPDLLLWARFNILFAFLFCLIIYYNEFKLKGKTPKENQ